MKRNLIGLTICRFQLFSENIVWHQSQKALTQLQQLESLSLEMWASTPNMPWLANLSIAPSGYNSPLKWFPFLPRSLLFCSSLSLHLRVCWLQWERGIHGHCGVQRQSLPECPEQDLQFCWRGESQQRGTWDRKRSEHRMSLGAFLLFKISGRIGPSA